MSSTKLNLSARASSATTGFSLGEGDSPSPPVTNGTRGDMDSTSGGGRYFSRDCSISNASGFQPGDDENKTIQSLHKSDYVVKDCSLVQAQEIIREHHYAKGGSNTAVYTHGLYEKTTNNLVGVAWWLPPTRVCCESVNKPEWKRVLSLTRLACLPCAPMNSESFLITHSTRLIKKDGRFCSLVSYADESQGHTGIIYRACGWEYIGRVGPYPRWIDSTGRQVACKATKNRNKSVMLALGHIQAGSFFKHKFVKHLETRP